MKIPKIPKSRLEVPRKRSLKKGVEIDWAEMFISLKQIKYEVDTLIWVIKMHKKEL